MVVPAEGRPKGRFGRVEYILEGCLAGDIYIYIYARSPAGLPSGTQSSPSSFAARVTLGTVCTRAGNTDVLSHPVVMTLSRASGPASHIYVAACANKVYIYI